MTEARPSVVVVDREDGVLAVLVPDLKRRGFDVTVVSSLEGAAIVIRQNPPDAVVVNVASFDQQHADEVVPLIRRISGAPLLAVVASETDAGESALMYGADDYTTEPFSANKLATRIRAMLVRARRDDPRARQVHAGDVKVDLKRRLVARDGEPVHLTKTEWQLLERLAREAGQVILSVELLRDVWGPEYEHDVQYLRVWISRLRRKLEARPGEQAVIKTMQGVGYMLEPTPPGEESGLDWHEPILALAAMVIPLSSAAMC